MPSFFDAPKSPTQISMLTNANKKLPKVARCVMEAMKENSSSKSSFYVEEKKYSPIKNI